MPSALAGAQAAEAVLGTWQGNLDITEETIALVKRAREAEITRSITLGTGLIGYDLHAPAEVVVPTFTPVVNSLPRVMGEGVDVHHFKAISSFGWDSAGGSFGIPGVVDENVNPASPAYQILNLFNVYQTIGVSNDVSFKAQWRGRSLEGDMRAKRMAELLFILKLIEEQWLIYYSDYLWRLPAPLAPTTAATGGTVAAGTYFVGVGARSANGETPTSFATSTVVTTGTTSTITVTFFTEPLASGYNIYIGASKGAATQVAAANLTVNGVVQSGNVATTGAIPQTIPNLAGNITVTITAPAGATAAPTVNTALVAKAAVGSNIPLTNNGIMGLIFGAGNAVYSNVVNGAPTAAFSAAGPAANTLAQTGLGEVTMSPVIAQPAAASGKLAYSDITSVLTAMFVQARANPDFMAVSPADNVDVTNLLYNAAGTRVVINADIPTAQGTLQLGTRVTKLLNPSTGKILDVEVWPYLPQGTIIFGSRTLPFPVAGFDGPVAKVLTNIDYYGLDYPPTIANPKFSFADYVDECLEISFLGGFAAITGIIP